MIVWYCLICLEIPFSQDSHLLSVTLGQWWWAQRCRKSSSCINFCPEPIGFWITSVIQFTPAMRPLDSRAIVSKIKQSKTICSIWPLNAVDLNISELSISDISDISEAHVSLRLPKWMGSMDRQPLEVIKSDRVKYFFPAANTVNSWLRRNRRAEPTSIGWLVTWNQINQKDYEWLLLSSSCISWMALVSVACPLERAARHSAAWDPGLQLADWVLRIASTAIFLSFIK